MSIIDYSLLLGEIQTDSLDKLRAMVGEAPELDRGVFIDSNNKTYIVGIIDTLTGFTTIKNLEYQFKKIKHGHEMSCVPPNVYGERFKKFIE